MEFFTSPDDLKGWIKSRKTKDEAASMLVNIVNPIDQQRVKDTCRQIFETKEDEEADKVSTILFGVLANSLKKTVKVAQELGSDEYDQEAGDDEYDHNAGDISTQDDIHWYQYGRLYVTGTRLQLCKKMIEDEFYPNVFVISDHGNAHLIDLSNEMEIAMQKGNNVDTNVKMAQSTSRQRNGWVRGMRNKWNRTVDGFNEGTPWRIDRDKFYNFTHYYTDDIKFDEDPTRVYSGEAIWRMYVMDKFTTEYMNKEGKWVGGYINDRFYVFPDAGTPDNPDAPRDGGNQMGLIPGERTRLPRPHQYSTERRLEEARGNKTSDITVNASANKTIKIASHVSQENRHNDNVYNIFKDVLDMSEAGIDFSTMLEATAKHYNTTILKVAQVYKEAKKLRDRHEGLMYSFATATTLGTSISVSDTWFVPETVKALTENNEPFVIPPNSTISIAKGFDTSSSKSELRVQFEDKVLKVPNWQRIVAEPIGDGNRIQEAADSLGLNETNIANNPATPAVAINPEENFNVTDVSEDNVSEKNI
jgi:hypothetical protein